MNIVEYIGKEGVITTNHRSIWTRLEHPKPGDLIDWAKEAGTYPYPENGYGRIERLNWFGDPDLLHVCVSQGSAFLGLLTMEDGTREPYLSMSGGPFEHIKKSDLVWSGKFAKSTFWNWGDNLSGPSNGVYYTVDRPVFMLREQYQIYCDELIAKVNGYQKE